MGSSLKLFADDRDGVAVISTMLQDGLVPLNDMEFLPNENSFVLAVNRFCWELTDEQKYRTHCGLRIDGVMVVQQQNLDRRQGDLILEILSLSYSDEDGRQSMQKLELNFSGGGTLRLLGKRLSCGLQDMGEVWPTQWQPEHNVD